MRADDIQYLKSRSSRKLWMILKGLYTANATDATLIIKELRKRRDTNDPWPDCDTPSSDNPACHKKGSKYSSVGW